MKAGLQLKLAQHLTLTPQLQQSIRLLQLSTLELQQEIEVALAENPLLELAESDAPDDRGADDPIDVPDTVDVYASAVDREALLDGSDSMAAYSQPEQSDTRETGQEFSSMNGDGGQSDSAEFTTNASTEAPTESVTGESDFDAPSLDFAEWGSAGAGSFDDDDESFESQRASPPSLREHLRSQLVLVKDSAEVLQLVHALIDSLDEHGYLSVTKSDIDDLLAKSGNEDGIPNETWDTALGILQSLEPAGVGASDLRECLLLQLKQCPNNGDTKLARRIVGEALEHLGKRDYARIKKLFDIDEIDLKDAHAVIRTLTPRPGAPFADISASLMVPDVIVRRNKRKWIAELNSVAVPRLSVNSVYADMLHREKEGRSTPLSTQLQEARWLVKNVAQRFDTILRVSSEIVERQQAFFDHGEVAMRPLVLR
ncbi:MAG: RNA polymerase factor sigma-54, partial [Casimicrobium sp.]